MRKKIILILLCKFCFLYVNGETYFLKKQYVDISYSLYNDIQKDEYSKIIFREHNFFGRIGFSITQSIYSGIVLNGITTKSNLLGKENEQFLLCGIYGQYYIFNRRRVKIFGEMSLSYGDYNAKHNETVSNREKNLFYLGITGGLKWRLFIDKLWFKTSFTWQPVLTKNKDFYGQYNLGNYKHNTLNIGVCYFFDFNFNLKIKSPKREKRKKGCDTC